MYQWAFEFRSNSNRLVSIEPGIGRLKNYKPPWFKQANADRTQKSSESVSLEAETEATVSLSPPFALTTTPNPEL